MSYTYINTDSKAEKLVNRLLAFAPTLYPFDIETTGLDPHADDVLMIQFQIPQEQENYIINCRKVSHEWQSNIMFALWREGEGELLGHNIKFDMKFMLAKFPDIYFHKLKDTFIIEQLITNGLVFKPPSLEELAEKYLNMKMEKSTRSEFINFKGDEFSTKQLEYGAADIAVLMPIYVAQKKFVNLYKLNFVEEVECRAVAAFAKMEVDGIFINYEKWQENENIAKTNRRNTLLKMNSYAKELYPEDLFGEPTINWNSPVQLLNLMKHLVDKNLPDTNEKTLQTYSHPFIDLLLEYRESQKLITSYGDAVLKQVSSTTGRLHPNFNQLGAKTGRISCKEPNVQQVPKTTLKDSEGKKHAIYREAFTPQLSTGKMVGADYSSFELRVLTDLTKEPEWIKGYTDNLDMHSVVAQFIFQVPVSKKQNKHLRDIGKAINFGR